jgi:hypothetical protein
MSPSWRFGPKLCQHGKVVATEVALALDSMM